MSLSLSPDLLLRAYERADAARWGLSREAFARALEDSVRGRFKEGAPSAGDTARYVESLQLADLALACACAEGRGEAWDHFVLQFRPVLYRSAESLRVPGDARELADTLYGELFGLEERDGERRSLFRYYHGRSSLAGWLRTVLAQRAVDRARAGKRLVSMDEGGTADEAAGRAAGGERGKGGDTDAPDPHRPRLVALLRAALAAALAALDPQARLRLALYYTQGLKLAQIGRIAGESEATVSRKLDRARRDVRDHVERALKAGGLSEAQVALCFEYAQEDQQFDLRQALPVPDS